MNAAAPLRPAAFLDRDGVLNIDTGYPHRPEQLVFTPTAIAAVRRLNQANFLVIVVTNQSGVARGLFGLAEVAAFHDEMQWRLALEGAHIDAFYVAPYHPAGVVAEYAIEHADRKPGAGMLFRALAEWPIDRRTSFLIGDKASDVQAGEGAGIHSVMVPPDSVDLDRVVAGLIAGRPNRSSILP